MIWATRDFFRIGKMLKRINKTFIALVPKIPTPMSLLDFRPISLCNTIYKIFAKVLVNRIKPFLERIIGSPQKGFVPGRQILDAVITTHEVIHSMKQIKRPSMAFKLNISKAYDKIKWDLLYDVLERVGFNNNVINMIKMMVGLVQYFVLLNGSPWGNFGVDKGLR